jgi:N-acetylmuramoyl-L-alanine amidase
MIPIWYPSPNYQPGAITVGGICDHVTAGAGLPSRNWLCNPASQVSAHFVVMEDGVVYQLVRTSDRAWAQGTTSAGSQWASWIPQWANPNAYLISIEHAGTPFSPTFMNPAQYAASLALHVMLVKQFNIPVDRDHILGHSRFDRINRVNCPGPNFPFDRLIADIKKALNYGEDPVMIAELQAQIVALQGQIDQLNGVNSDLGRQLAYCQQLKAEVETRLNQQVTDLRTQLVAAQTPNHDAQIKLDNLKAAFQAALQ